MPHMIESDFEHEGLRCIVIFSEYAHRCGYVGISPHHPLYGVEYGQAIDNDLILKEVKEAKIGKRGIIPVAFWDGERVRPDVIFNVHGGLTYSRGLDTYPIETDKEYWWFGFDCAHYNDAKDWKKAFECFPNDKRLQVMYDIDRQYRTHGVVRSKEYVEQECRNLAEQLGCVSQLMESKEEP